MKGSSDKLIISLARIPEDGLEIDETLPREWLTDIPEFSDDQGTHIEGTIRVRGTLTREGDNLRLNGEVSAELVTICCRCGETIRYPLSSSFDVVLIHGREEVSAEERELMAEEMAEAYFEGDEVDLNPFFREEIMLQAPFQPLCRPDCAGLCPMCGTNLNTGSCGCKPQEGDPRLAVLKNLKLAN